MLLIYQERRCDLCDVDFTSVVMAKAHLAGKQHLQRLKVSLARDISTAAQGFC
jgi:hypothetical protein